MKYLIHDKHGKILRKGICPPQLLSQQNGEGEISIEDVWEGTDGRIHRIEGGKRVEFTPPPPPAPNHNESNGRAMIQRRAAKLAAAGQGYEALSLLKRNGL